MTRKDAETFVAQALINMEQCVEKKSFKQTFFQAVKLFLYLLRYREIDQTFLLHDNQQDRQLFDRAIDCLEFAQNYVRENPIEFQNALLSRRTRTRRVADLTTARRTAEKAAYLMDEIRKYMFLEGDSNIIPVLNAFANTSDEP